MKIFIIAGVFQFIAAAANVASNNIPAACLFGLAGVLFVIAGRMA